MSKTSVTTGLVTFAYVHVFQPSAMDANSTEKYSASIIIPKSDKKTTKAIKSAIDNALVEGASKFGGKIPKNYKNPLRDGDLEREDDENYKDSYFINANSTIKPGIVDADINEIIDQDEFYSGCIGRANINFYAFNVNGNKGVAAGLNHVQKVKDGTRLSGPKVSAEEAFGDEYDDSDDLM